MTSKILFYLKPSSRRVPPVRRYRARGTDAYQPNATWSQPLATLKEVLYRQLEVAQNRAEKTRPDRLARMHRHCSYSAIGMPQKQVATSRPQDLKSEFFEETHQFLAL